MNGRISAVAIFLVSTLLIQGCDKAENSTSTTSGSKSDTVSGYTLQQKELVILDRLLQDEQEAFLAGEEGILFGNKMPFVSAYDVSKQYEENQVAADQKFFEKKLHVNGTIESINSGFGNEPYVSLRGSNQLLSPQIHFDKGNIETIASLKKGQRVNFLCEGGGAVIGIPMFKECIFASDYAEKKASDAKLKVEAFMRGEKPKSDVIPKLSIVAIAVARELPDTSTCFTDASKCKSEISTIFNKETAKQKMTEISDELKKLGVLVPDAYTIQK